MCTEFLFTEFADKKNILPFFFNLCQACELIKILQSTYALTSFSFLNSNWEENRKKFKLIFSNS